MAQQVYTWPREFWRVASCNFYLASRSITSGAWLTGRKNVHGPHVSMWVCRIELAPMPAEQWRTISGFISRLDGEQGLFRIGDPSRVITGFDAAATITQQPWSDDTLFTDGTGWAEGGLPETCIVAAPVVQGGKTIVLGGLPASTPNVLRAGDLFELRPNGEPTETGNLYEIVVGGGTDEEGRAGVEIRPRLRQSFAPGDMVVLRYPTSVFRMVDGEQAIVEHELADIGRIGFNAVEHIP